MASILFLLSLLTPSLQSDTLVGKLSTLQHDVSGSVYIRDSETLVIREFYYDGQGPGRVTDNTIYFYIGNSSYPYSPEDAKRGYKDSDGFKVILPFPSAGEFYEYDDENAPDLKQYFNSLMEDQNVKSRKGTPLNKLEMTWNLVLDVVWPDPMIVKLPSIIQTDEITFLSVWCRNLGINFGHVEFPLKNMLYN